MRVIVTGSAGFIGSAVALRLLEEGNEVCGVDNHNAYYDPALKEARVNRNKSHPGYKHYRVDISDSAALKKVFMSFKPQKVVHLAAQAGVRYSLDNPLAYVQSNIVGFAHILEECRAAEVEHLVYASSSSVYGANTRTPFSVEDSVDHPLNLYAASKKSNELMAHAYSHLYQLPTTGLRFFTVYGPWGRPDMAPFKFVKLMLEQREINVYNYGNHKRDFTYIDDVVTGALLVLNRPPLGDPNWSGEAPDPSSSLDPWRVYNLGNQRPVHLMDFISCLEERIGRPAKKKLLPMQLGDLLETSADSEALFRDLGYCPSTPVREGVNQLVTWYETFHAP